MRQILALALVATACGSPSAPPPPSPEARIRAAMEAVRPLHATLAPPGPDEWLASFPEPRQTFDDYLGQDPVTAIRLSPEIRQRLDNWRRRQVDLPTRSEAIRRLLEAGLKGTKA